MSTFKDVTIWFVTTASHASLSSMKPLPPHISQGKIIFNAKSLTSCKSRIYLSRNEFWNSKSLLSHGFTIEVHQGLTATRRRPTFWCLEKLYFLQQMLRKSWPLEDLETHHGSVCFHGEDKVFKNFNATVQPETPLFYHTSYFREQSIWGLFYCEAIRARYAACVQSYWSLPGGTDTIPSCLARGRRRKTSG